jgi:hypothetical protein
MEGRWFFLARSYENEQRTDFTPRQPRSKIEPKLLQATAHFEPLHA